MAIEQDKQKAKKKYLDFLYSQYQKGVSTSENIELLRNEGYIKEGAVYAKDIQRRDVDHRMGKYNRDPFAGLRVSKMNIHRDDWIPESTIYHKDDFVEWINSMVYGRLYHKVKYHPFDLYKEQARRWLEDGDILSDYNTHESRREFIYREYDRIAQNTLYFANRYGELKEGDVESGIVQYKAKEHHAVIFYLLDCGYSIIAGKGRQIGFTSAMGLYAIKKMIIQQNYYIKFVTEDQDTGEEIFNDKIKYVYGALPTFLQPPVKSDAERRFALSDKPSKGKKGYPNTRLDVIAPKTTAINGGSPQLVIIDEIGNIPILGSMLNEARPTMFWENPETGKFEMKRQILMFGTGGHMLKGKGAYEKEWYRILGLWEAGRFEAGFVPLFFSWEARLDAEEYLKEKEWYFGARAVEEDIEAETSRTQFYQHYPTNYKDMFITTANTLVSRDIIDSGIERCRNLHPSMMPVYGYFEPVYDYNDPMPPESDTPFRIVDAEFVPVDEEDMHKATVIIFQKPEAGWFNRYWQGTDPIATETGHSRMASTMWDDYYKTVSALLNYRKQHNHKYTFLQCVLLGLYYDVEPGKVKTGVKELVEANNGTNYIDYKESKGFLNSLVFNAELPNKLQGGGREIGIDNKGIRADGIIEYMINILKSYHQNIYIKTYFEQLTTFVLTITKSGKEVWGPVNKNMHYDDALYSIAFAPICRDSFPHKNPYRQDTQVHRMVTRHVLVRDGNNNLIRVPKRVPAKRTTYEETV